MMIKKQQGATLVIGLIMLVLITLIVTTAYSLSSTNLKAVGNLQFHKEALAAANTVLEQMVGTTFATVPTATSVDVDINQDGNNDYTVDIAVPTCISGTPVTWTSSSSGNNSSIELEHIDVDPATASGGSGNNAVNKFLVTATYYNTIWDIKATVTDLVTGATVKVHEGVRAAPMTEAEYTAVCS